MQTIRGQVGFMPGDRRKSDSRRSSDRRGGDRRAGSNERRGTDGRRTVDKPAPSAPTKSEPTHQEARPGNMKDFVLKWAKRLALVFMGLIVCLTFLLVYFFANFEYYMGQVAQKVKIENTSASIDAKSLTDRTARASLAIKVKNGLPLPIVVQNLNLNVKVSGYIVAKGIQIMPKIRIESDSQKVLKVGFHVDSIMARRGLQKTVEKNAGPILKTLISKLQGKNEKMGENLKGIMTAVGSVEYKLILGGIEIPFKQNLEFAQ